MKSFFAFICCSLLLIACGEKSGSEGEQMNYPADSISADGKMSFHGMRIDDAQALAVSDLKAHVFNGGSPEVKIEGEINACCQAKGCWMTMPLDENTDMRVTFKDYGFFVPKDAAGKTAIAEGRVFTDTVSVEERRHFAVDGGMSEEEARQTITEPEISLAFEATGVIIKGE